jgi:hypothetical protein
MNKIHYIICNDLLASFRAGVAAGYNGLAAPQKAVPVKHDDSAAAAAAHLDIGTGADDGPFAGTAGMGLAGSDDVADQNLLNHGNTSLMPEYYMIINQRGRKRNDKRENLPAYIIKKTRCRNGSG